MGPRTSIAFESHTVVSATLSDMRDYDLLSNRLPRHKHTSHTGELAIPSGRLGQTDNSVRTF